MAFWNRLRQTRLNFQIVSKEYKRCYATNHHPFIARQFIYSRNPVRSNTNCYVRISLSEFCNNVRFYAAPFQVNQKKDEKDASGPRLNEKITAPAVRLVLDEGHCVVSRHEALARAKSLNLDLVEVDRNSKPPVCKIFDYHKDKYVQQTKEKERAKSKTALKKGGFKEVRFAAKIEQKDLQIKADMVKRLMESGHRVKCTAIEPTNDLDLQTLLSRFSSLIEDIAIEESSPKVEKKQAFVVVRHVKFGPSKKGSGKKASKNAVPSDADSQTSKNQPGSEPEPTESEDSPDEDVHQIFYTNDDENRLGRNSEHDRSAVASGPSSSVDRNLRHVVEPPASHAIENRYARPGGSSRIPMDNMNNHGVPRIPNQGMQPQFSMNRLPPTRPSSQAEAPARESFKQDSSRTSLPNSSPKSYGIFSSQNANPTGRGQRAPEESNRYMKNSHSNGTTTASPNMNRGPPGVDNPSPAKWGRFSADNSNGAPNRRNESQAEVGRR